MKDYQSISVELAKRSHQNQQLKRIFENVLSDVKAFNGSIQGVSEVSFTATQDSIDVEFFGYTFQFKYRYKIVGDESRGVLCLYKISDIEENDLKSETEFNVDGGVIGSGLSFASETETMAVILNLLANAVES